MRIDWEEGEDNFFSDRNISNKAAEESARNHWWPRIVITWRAAMAPFRGQRQCPDIFQLGPSWQNSSCCPHRWGRGVGFIVGCDKTMLSQLMRLILIKYKAGTSLVVQWIRICLPMQGTGVRSLVQEDSTCHRASKPVPHNYWACALEPASPNY